MITTTSYNISHYISTIVVLYSHHLLCNITGCYVISNVHICYSYTWNRQCYYAIQCSNYNMYVQYELYTCTVLYIVQCTIYTVHCTLYTLYCILYIVQCTLYIDSCAMNNNDVHYKLFIVPI